VDLPSPLGLAEILAGQAPERARAVADEVSRRSPGSVTALTFAAEVARTVDEDPERAADLLEQALEAPSDIDGAVELARHLIMGGLVDEAIEVVEEALVHEPEDEDAQEIRAVVLAGIHRRAAKGGEASDYGSEMLERFGSRKLLYRLRDAMVAFVDDWPELSQHIAGALREWLEQLADDELVDLDELVEGGGELVHERHEGLMRMAIERAWVTESDPDDDELELDEDPGPSTAPLALLAHDPQTAPDIAEAAHGWLETCEYGLWQVRDPAGSPGVWLTDIASGVRRYAAVPPEQLEQAGKWGVFLCPLVAIDGVWRTTGAALHLRPAEADAAAELVRMVQSDLERVMRGKRARGPRPSDREPEPHGVLVERAEPLDPLLTGVSSVAIRHLLPVIVSEVWRRRQDGPTLANTDGHRLKFITALVSVRNQVAAAKQLAAHQDFKTEDDGELTWWGRELTGMEQASALAPLRAQFGDDEPIDNSDETPRWLRGRLRSTAQGFKVEVNSDERLQALMGVLEELGLEPELGRHSAIDPPMDLPPIRVGRPTPFGSSRDAIDAWLKHWPDERLPALGGRTPRATAQLTGQRPRLEELLREFEHDAWLLEREGAPTPDIDRLRTELGMERWWEPATVSR